MKIDLEKFRQMKMERAEKKASEFLSLKSVIDNRLQGMTSEDFKLLSVDSELWATVSLQLREAAKLALEISYLVVGRTK